MPLPKAQYIWMNGEFLPWDDARVHVTAHVLHYGSSVFEGIRAYATPDGPAVLWLQQHLRRLYQSCALFRMEAPYPYETVSETILEMIRRNGHHACYIRPLVYRGAGGFSLDSRTCPAEMAIVTFEWGVYLGDSALEKGVDVMVSSYRRMAPSTFPAMAKVGGNYVNSQLIVMEAVDNGCHEGLALDINGFVSEGSGENIFVVYQDVVYTPPASASILMGITREYVIRLLRKLGYEVREQMIPREMLYIADELFFTGTAAEITPVNTVDHRPVGGGECCGPVARGVQKAFFDIVNGRVADTDGWLTHVNR